MKKQLNEAGIANELKGSSLFFQKDKSGSTATHVPITEKSEIQRRAKLVSTSKPVSQSTSRPVGQPIDKSTAQSTSELIDKTDILGRPKAFYITEKQDKDLDAVVEKLSEKVEGKVGQKIDRSTIIRLLLEANEITTDEAVDQLADQLINRLISQLKG